jgi:hypothetical protein
LYALRSSGESRSTGDRMISSVIGAVPISPRQSGSR